LSTRLDTDSRAVGMYQTSLILERTFYSYKFHYFILIRFNVNVLCLGYEQIQVFFGP